MRAEAEYVDPAQVLAHREYAWSRERNRDGTAAWDALRDDIAENGFRDPAILSYNHVTGEGYFGEGNHRIGIALELGIAVPVVIFRSTKTAPDWPMKRVTAPGRYSMRDERGLSRFRELMSPSEIGLPTVPDPRAAIENEASGLGREPDGMEL